uniref:elastin-like isoform X3 n=1 Tax=Monopterus albus TaxID=43700 RepID=UPI0009B41D6C|nr:elastin-like isoform X3 [Monopterus albus]
MDETATYCLLAGPTPIAAIGKAPGVPQPTGVAGGIIQPSAGTSIGGTGVGPPLDGATGVQQPAGGGPGVKAPKPLVPGVGTGVGTLPGAKPLKPPAVGGAGIPLTGGGYFGGYSPYHHGYGQGGLTYPSAVGLGGVGAGAKPPKPGYGNLGPGGGFQPGPPGFGGYPQQYYPGGYVPAPLTPQQAKAAKYGPLQGFLGGTGGVGGFYGGGVAGCQGKYCGRRK